MRENRMISRAAWLVSLLLGQTSLLLGLMIAIGWTLSLAFILPTKADGWMAGGGFGLPVEPPLIGLAIGAIGLLVSRFSREPIARFSVAGMIFNALSLALTILSIIASSTR